MRQSVMAETRRIVATHSSRSPQTNTSSGRRLWRSVRPCRKGKASISAGSRSMQLSSKMSHRKLRKLVIHEGIASIRLLSNDRDRKFVRALNPSGRLVISLRESSRELRWVNRNSSSGTSKSPKPFRQSWPSRREWPKERASWKDKRE